MVQTPVPWSVANQRSLMAELERLRRQLQSRAPGAVAATPVESVPPVPEPPPAWQVLTQRFGLSPFERDVLLLCVGAELAPDWGLLCGQALGLDRAVMPSFGLAQRCLEAPHWSACVPAAPLRRWSLVEINPASPLLQAELRLDERILHYLMGIDDPDQRLLQLLSPLEGGAVAVGSQQHQVAQLVQVWRHRPVQARPPLQLWGCDRSTRQAIAAEVCGRLGLGAYRLPGQALPQAAADLQTFLRLWQRETYLGPVALVVDWDDRCDRDDRLALALHTLTDGLQSALMVLSPARLPLGGRTAISLEVTHPSSTEQQQLWHQALTPLTPAPATISVPLAHQFNLSRSQIEAVAAQVPASPEPDGLLSHLWDRCRSQARPRLDDLAQRLTPQETWDDLVLPAPQREVLHDIVDQVQQRSLVYSQWGFSQKSSRGLGISALFAGTSGTGKTMAASILAQALNLDLYRIDLSAVVSKYIGETEKNLRQVFDAAETGSVILLFDEADALFGKRSEVKDSHDRHANLEVSYLLQRMEAYQGLAILTTNLKDALDTAFLRRIRFIVRFPFPDVEQRLAIWRRIFPEAVPRQDLSYRKLSKLNVSGGIIRNIALTAAFLAAKDQQPVTMAHLLAAAQREYAKLERPLPSSEVQGWGE